VSEITEYPQTARGLWPEYASDLVTYRQRTCPEWPDLPRWTAIVSRADIEMQRARNRVQVPKRNAEGRRLSCIFDELQQRQAKAYAKRHGHTFTIHIANLDAAEIITEKEGL